MRDGNSEAVMCSAAALADYAAGNLSPAKHLIIKAQKELSETVAALIALEERSAGQGLDDISEQPLSSSFLTRVIEVLPPQNSTDFEKEFSVNDNDCDPVFEKAINSITWRRYIPGIAVHNVIGSRWFGGDDRLYMFNAKAGSKVPEHSHRGEEWVLVLKGSYTANGEVYRRGDLHIVTGDEPHSLHISDDEDCICLAMTQQPIKMKGLLPRVAQMVIGL